MKYLCKPENFVANCRDLGGLRTVCGNTVRAQRLLRSSTLAGLSQRIADFFTEALGPCRYFDLRTDHEVERDGSPDALVTCGWQWQRIPISDGSADQNAALVRYQEGMPLYLNAARQILEEISQESVNSRPNFVACSLGKDRTGLVVALILKWAGVFSFEIASDFALSNQHLADQRHLLLPRWRDLALPFNTVSGNDCVTAIGAISPDFFPSDSRPHWLETFPRMERSSKC
jgi:protein-tyrosine phosphatase